MSNTIERKPMLQEQVYKTTDYFLFKTLDGNRQLNTLHLKRLIKSMEKSALFSPIIVNENHEVIDGQHRLEALKSLKLPVHYIVIRGYGLREVQILNANSKTWNADDFMNGYCDLGFKDYITYKEFKDNYGFDHNSCMTLLAWGTSGKNVKDFYEGNFKILDIETAKDYAEKISLLKEFYAGYKRRSFILAMTTLLKNEDFSFVEFIAKLKLQPTALVDCKDITQYKMLIEEIFNYRRKPKVNLRY